MTINNIPKITVQTMRSILITMIITFFTLSIRAQNTFPSSGNVGIGTLTPGAPLHTVSYSTSANNNTAVFYVPNIGPNPSHIHWGTNGDWYIRSANSAGKVIIQDSGGNVGIGTSTPNSILEINSSSHSNASLALTLTSSNSSHNSSGILSFSSLSTTAPFYIYSWDDDLQFTQRNPDGSWKSHFMTFRNSTGDVTFDNNVGIGTTTPDAKLTVKGNIHAEEVTLDLLVPWPDYVFEEDYDLATLEETETYIKANKHLPEIPSAKTMEEDGIDVGVMNMLLLKKIEELTLHVITQNKNVDNLTVRVKEQQKEIDELKSRK